MLSIGEVRQESGNGWSAQIARMPTRVKQDVAPDPNTIRLRGARAVVTYADRSAYPIEQARLAPPASASSAKGDRLPGTKPWGDTRYRTLILDADESWIEPEPARILEALHKYHL